tara:strand:- start:176 stop:1855 length:1680 start_codon:yes stop_codon:yes gene_type:complete
MNQSGLKNLIKKLVQEYTGTGAGGRNHPKGDGNLQTSPRVGGSFHTDEDELFDYIHKNVYGGEGNHYSKYSPKSNYNRRKFVRFEGLKKYIKQVLKELGEQAYGSATLTTQGQSIHRAPGVWQEDEKELKEQIDPRIQANNNKITQNNIENLKLALANQERQVQIQLDQSQQQAASQTKGVNQASAAEATVAKELKDLRSRLALKSATRSQLNTDMTKDPENFAPEDVSRLEDLEKEIKELDKEIKTTKNKLKQADAQEQNALKAKSSAMGAGARATMNAQRALRKARQTTNRQIAQMRKQLAEDYFKKRKNSNLMEHIDSYKREILLEKAINKFFEFFDKGKTNEEVLRIYAERGVVVPEQFIAKARKKHESLKRDRLDLEELETETKNFKKIPLVDEDEINEKELSSRLFKENKITKKYSIPPELKIALEDDLKMYPLVRFVNNLKAANTIPPSYRIFLLNGQFFDIYYEEYSLMVKIGPDNYYLDNVQEKNYAVKHINRLLTQPTMTQGDVEEDEIDDIIPPTPPKRQGRPPAAPKPPAPTPTPPTPPTPTPEDEE